MLLTKIMLINLHIINKTCNLFVSLNLLDPGFLAKFQRFVFNVIYNPFAVLFVILCILLNTLFMALDHHAMSQDLEEVLTIGNYVSLIIVIHVNDKNNISAKLIQY